MNILEIKQFWQSSWNTDPLFEGWTFSGNQTISANKMAPWWLFHSSTQALNLSRKFSFWTMNFFQKSSKFNPLKKNGHFCQYLKNVGNLNTFNVLQHELQLLPASAAASTAIAACINMNPFCWNPFCCQCCCWWSNKASSRRCRCHCLPLSMQMQMQMPLLMRMQKMQMLLSIQIQRCWSRCQCRSIGCHCQIQQKGFQQKGTAEGVPGIVYK